MAIVVEDQGCRFLDEHPSDVVEPQIGPAEQACRPAEIEPIERSALAQKWARWLRLRLLRARLPSNCTEALVSLRWSGLPSR